MTGKSKAEGHDDHDDGDGREDVDGTGAYARA